MQQTAESAILDTLRSLSVQSCSNQRQGQWHGAHERSACGMRGQHSGDSASGDAHLRPGGQHAAAPSQREALLAHGHHLALCQPANELNF